MAKGYHAAGMDDIADRAGVSKPVLYQHFPSKLELYIALLDTQTDTLAQAVQRALDSTDDNHERVHGVLSAYFDFVDRADQDGAFRLIFESDLVNDPAVRSRVEGVTQKTAEAVAITVASDTGIDEASAHLLAISLTGAAQVAARWWLNAGRPVSRDAAIDLLEALMWRGISNFPKHDELARTCVR